MMLKINGIDLTRHIVVGSYAINNVDNYVQWTDIDGGIHRVNTTKKKRKAKGSCTIHFRTKDDMEVWQYAVTAMGDVGASNRWAIEAYLVNEGRVKSFHGYVSMNPAHTIRGSQGMMADFQLTIEEA